MRTSRCCDRWQRPYPLIFWTTATFWIPLLIVLFAWKHVVRHEPVRYEPGRLSIVFSLGMYATATEVFSRAAGLPFLCPVPEGFFLLASASLLLAALCLVRSLCCRASASKQPGASDSTRLS